MFMISSKNKARTLLSTTFHWSSCTFARTPHTAARTLPLESLNARGKCREMNSIMACVGKVASDGVVTASGSVGSVGSVGRAEEFDE